MDEKRLKYLYEYMYTTWNRNVKSKNRYTKLMRHVQEIMPEQEFFDKIYDPLRASIVNFNASSPR